MISPKITEDLRLEAKRVPGGWVYVLKPEYRGKDDVPLDGILGAWRVDVKGEVVGDFIPVSDFHKYQ